MMPITQIVEVKIKPQRGYSYILNYRKEHYDCREDDKELGYIHWFFRGFGYVAVIYTTVDINVGFRGCWVYLSDLCEQDFQDILIPTQNELILFELKYGFEFPFQIKNSKHPVMINI